MRKVIPLIAGALLAGTVGLLRNGGQAETPRADSKRKRTIATAQKRSPAKAKRRAKGRRR